MIHLPCVYAIEEFPNINSVKVDTEQWQHLKGLKLDSWGKVHLLIGQDAFGALIPLQVRKGRDDEP